MKYLVKIFIFSTLLTTAANLHAKVTGIQYSILYNSETQFFDCFMYVAEGQTTSIRDRVQFNAQYSLMIPTGASINIESSYMPLTNNQNFKGVKPIEWTVSSKLKAPQVAPEFDFYGITATLAPTGFYDNLKSGDFVKLFSINVKGENIDLELIKIFDNEFDLQSDAQGMKNGDFSNGFTMGGYQQLYNGIKRIDQQEANYTSIDNKK